MANPEHIATVLKGRRAVDEWLSREPLARIDLSNANLEGVDLSGVNLSGVRLDEPHSDAIDNLPKSERIARIALRAAILSGANLRSANLTHAILIGADFSGADLTGANLTDAICSDALGLSAVDFSNAILEDIRLVSDTMVDSDHPFLELATSRGLESAKGKSVEEYIERCFAYLHNPPSQEWGLADANPKWLRHAMERIRSLGRVFDTEEPSAEIIRATGDLSRELVEYLRRHPEALFQISSRRFEELIAEILASFGWSVQLTAATRDGGYDIFAMSRDPSGLRTSWIVECKRYAPERKVGISVIRGLYAAKGEIHAANALLATTSSFTTGAARFKGSRYDLELRDYVGIVEWINEYRPNPGGRLYMKDNRLILP